MSEPKNMSILDFGQSKQKKSKDKPKRAMPAPPEKKPALEGEPDEAGYTPEMRRRLNSWCMSCQREGPNHYCLRAETFTESKDFPEANRMLCHPKHTEGCLVCPHWVDDEELK